MFRRLFLVAASLAFLAEAAPPLSTIQDVLYKADGTRFSGTLTISWKSFQPGADAAVVPQGSTVVKVTDGFLRIQLVPSTTATPVATYSVLYNSDGRTQFRETWAVPPSGQTLHVHDVRIATSPGTTGADTSTAAALAESSIPGLIADLGSRPVKSPNFSAGRVAMVDAGGLMASVNGNPSDCVRVDGSAGPCGTSSLAFVDGDTLSGLVDGANTSFGLSAVPNPTSSLAVYRNGVLQKAVQDYSLTGNTVQFIAAAAPQPGDTLLASYRTDASDTSATSAPVTSPQVLCSGSGSNTSSGVLASIGACTIPAGVLMPGDRVEIRFDLAHQGSAGGFSLEMRWGATTVVHRDAAAAELLVSGRCDATILSGSAQTSSQTWGGQLAFGATVGNAADNYSGGLTVNLMGSVAQAADRLTLNNFTVVRIP